MPSEIKIKTIHGFLWSAIERFSAQGIQFLIGLILARLLLPSDYGLIGMLTIFLAISQMITNSGFSHALIQKKWRTETDYSTAFFFNIGIGLFNLLPLGPVDGGRMLYTASLFIFKDELKAKKLLTAVSFFILAIIVINMIPWLTKFFVWIWSIGILILALFI